MQMTNQERFNRFCLNVRASYAQHADRLRDFNDAVSYLSAHVQEYLENGLTASHNGIAVVVNYNESQGLRVTHVRSGAVAMGYVRQLKDLIEQITPSDNPRQCETCRRNHKVLGLEIEFKALTDRSGYDGNVYRNALLMKLNNKRTISPDSDDYGIDGSQVPIELRNINGNTPAEIAETLKERLNRFNECFEFMKANFPGVNPSIDTTECGIHVHSFHKGYTRDKVLSAHSLVGVLVNSYAMTDWKSRIPRGYGVPYAHRIVATQSRRPWCRNEVNATELRMFGVMKPEILKWSLDQMTALLGNQADATVESWRRYISTYHIAGLAMVTGSGLREILQYFVNHGVVTLEQLTGMIEWLNVHYVPFHRDQTVTSVITLDMVRGLTPRAVPAPVRRPAPETEMDRSIRRTMRQGGTLTREQARAVRARLQEAQRADTYVGPVEPTETLPETSSIWCTRINHAHDNPRQYHPVLTEDGQIVQYFRNSLHRHFDRCNECRNLLSGWRIMSSARVPFREQNVSGFGFFDRQRASAPSTGLGPDGYGR